MAKPQGVCHSKHLKVPWHRPGYTYNIPSHTCTEGPCGPARIHPHTKAPTLTPQNGMQYRIQYMTLIHIHINIT